MCGFIHSIFDTVPDTVTGLSPSYSAANEWCANAVTDERSRTVASARAAFMAGDATTGRAAALPATRRPHPPHRKAAPPALPALPRSGPTRPTRREAPRPTEREALGPIHPWEEPRA